MTHLIPIIPIHFTSSQCTEVLAAARRIEADLKAAGFDVEIDDRPIRPGAKFLEWENRGAVLRIELGPKDVARQRAVVQRFGVAGSVTVRLGDVAAYLTVLKARSE